jgi:hypothetical protein
VLVSAPFEDLQAQYARAERVSGLHEWFGELAGRTIRLRAASPALLERLTPALAHLEVPPGPPDFTVCCWDQPLQLPPWLLQREAAFESALSSEVWRESMRGTDGSTLLYEIGVSRTLSCCRGAAALYWVDDAARMPDWHVTSPLQFILSWWAGGLDLQYVHSAAVGTEGGALLLAGPSGSGKSTTALTCLGSALQYLGDDYCLVDLASMSVHSLYASAKLVDLERFPQLTAWADPVRGPKVCLNVYRHSPQSMLRSAPLRAVVIPRVVGGRDSVLRPLGQSRALLALAPSTLLQLTGSDQASFQRLSRLIRSVPCYQLELGTQTRQLVPLLQGLLHEECGLNRSIAGK